jgi:hypothetical protein
VFICVIRFIRDPLPKEVNEWAEQQSQNTATFLCFTNPSGAAADPSRPVQQNAKGVLR